MFPSHWTPAPEIETKDVVEWPFGYGQGSSSMKAWILENVERDRAREQRDQSPTIHRSQIWLENWYNVVGLIVGVLFVLALFGGGYRVHRWRRRR